MPPSRLVQVSLSCSCSLLPNPALYTSLLLHAGYSRQPESPASPRPPNHPSFCAQGLFGKGVKAANGTANGHANGTAANGVH